MELNMIEDKTKVNLIEEDLNMLLILKFIKNNLMKLQCPECPYYLLERID